MAARVGKREPPISVIRHAGRTLAWLGHRLGQAGPGVATRRAWSIWSRGRSSLLADHLRHGELSAARDERYRRWIADDEPALLAGAPCIEGMPSADGPLISIIVPTFNTPEKYLCECIESVLAQSYTNWELCLVDDASPGGEGAAVAKEYAGRDGRIRFVPRAERGGISAASNDALATARGEFVAFVDHDDVLAPKALGIVAAALTGDERIDVVYSDEDKIDDDGTRHTPAFKPGLSRHHLLTSNYICHLLVARRSVVQKLGGLRSAFDGAQDYDLVLRLMDAARRIEHVAYVLYHWRSHSGSTSSSSGDKAYAATAGREALADWFASHGLRAVVEDGDHALCYRVVPDVTADEQADVIALSEPIGREFPIEVYNAARHSRWCLLMEARLHVEPEDWIDRIIATALLPGAGAVGATIIDGPHAVSESGWFIDVDGRPVARHHGCSFSLPGYFWSLRQNRNVSFVRPTFMLVEWSAIDELQRHTDHGDDGSMPWYARLCRDLRRRGEQVVVAGDVCARRSTGRGSPGEGNWRGAYDGLLNPNVAAIEPGFAGIFEQDHTPVATGETACAALSG